MKKMSKITALVLAVMMILAMSACGSKDALAGTWSADLGDDGVITWTFDGKGECTMENFFGEQEGTYSIEEDQLTVQLELWDSPTVYTFSVDGNQLTIDDKEGLGISGTFDKK